MDRHTGQITPLALLRLLRLASPTLPIGAYSYSQGLESAIAADIVTGESTATAWIADNLMHSITRLEAPIFLRLHDAWSRADFDAVCRWSDIFLASRDTAEFRAETLQMGYSLFKLLADLLPAHPLAAHFPARGDDPLPAAMAAACVMLETPRTASLHAMLFSWAENQVLAALKAVPLGQVAGQRMLLALEPDIIAAAKSALALDDDGIGNWTPGLSLLSMRHETQYSRIFRS